MRTLQLTIAAAALFALTPATGLYAQQETQFKERITLLTAEQYPQASAALPRPNYAVPCAQLERSLNASFHPGGPDTLMGFIRRNMVYECRLTPRMNLRIKTGAMTLHFAKGVAVKTLRYVLDEYDKQKSYKN